MTHDRRLPALGTALSLSLLTGLCAPALRSQDLVGCQLVDGSLQCVPGLDATPQQQIRILRGEISTDLQLEGAVEQRIEGLQALVLQGQAQVGALLQASLVAEGGGAMAATGNGLQYHWYRLAPGRLHWEQITGAAGPTYTPGPNDIAYQLMVVVRTDGGTTQRVGSKPTGPVRAGNPAP
ncbi:MAG: hypothetical protein ACOVNL_10140 [Prochlorococcaceae cyanobacterium]|jgi:hypothetical protein